MCGRYSLTTPVEAMRNVFGFRNLPNLAPRYNIGPGQPVAIIRRAAGGERELAHVLWGLIPGWAKNPAGGTRMINARAETVAEKPAFRAAFRHRRCLVPADGFYEWQASGREKQPWHIGLDPPIVFAFAGLWEMWQGADGSELETCTIVTTDANDLLRPIHHRMPAILAGSDYETWLTAEPVAAGALLQPFPGRRMRAYRVGRHVNNARHEDAGCVAPLDDSDGDAAPRQASLL